jgi:hypothetical protein
LTTSKWISFWVWIIINDLFWMIMQLMICISSSCFLLFRSGSWNWFLRSKHITSGISVNKVFIEVVLAPLPLLSSFVDFASVTNSLNRSGSCFSSWFSCCSECNDVVLSFLKEENCFDIDWENDEKLVGHLTKRLKTIKFPSKSIR